MVYVPVAVEEATVMVITEVPEPGAAIGFVPKPTVTPDGCPLADKATAPSKTPITVLVIVEVPEFPCATDTEAGDAARVNPVPVTVSVTLVEAVVLPEVPVTVMVYLPVGVEDATVIVITEVPEPGAAIGFVAKPTVTPDGWPLADKVTAALKPPVAVLVIVEVPELP